MDCETEWRPVRANRKNGKEKVLLTVSIMSVVTGIKYNFEKIPFFTAKIIYVTRGKGTARKKMPIFMITIFFFVTGKDMKC
jgi:hypothetical protein